MAKKIMIQGTMSGSGKSFVVAGLCRYFKNQGYKVAPFKSQNMALNSYVTAEGLEIGRAQAMQAEAAGVVPSVSMNPILLKPNSDFGSQVILNGKVHGNVRAMDYFFHKKQFIPEILSAFHKLEEEYDIIVIEGAGSPAEINLKQDDIVNMGLAKLVDAPVLLVGDIDRGGVFASLFGTVKLLDNEEQERIKGLIINKFRGDLKILEPGLGQLFDLLQKKIVGCIPMRNIDIEDEDSLSERFKTGGIKNDGGIHVAVIHFPHISNFTDFNVFERVDGISSKYIERFEKLDEYDLIVLPGTKSTIRDLNWLRSVGLDAEIKKQAAMRKPVIGICGGYQMLGRRIIDRYGVESDVPKSEGLGLLDMETCFEKQKTTKLAFAKFVPSMEEFGMSGLNPSDASKGMQSMSGLNPSDASSAMRNKPFDAAFPIHAYEIHMGNSKNLGGCVPFVETDKGDIAGLQAKDRTVFGTYLHGFFDNLCVLEFLERITGKCVDKPEIDYYEYKEREYEKLGALMEESLDMEYIKTLMGL